MTPLARAGAAAALILALASCGSDPAEERAAAPEQARGEPAAAVIPAAMRGRWGLAAADCAPGPPRPEGLIEVGASEIRFHESRARLARVAQSGPRHIVADFDYRGEGGTWVLRERFDLLPDGQALVRRDGGPAPRLEADLYRRCPSLAAPRNIGAVPPAGRR